MQIRTNRILYTENNRETLLASIDANDLVEDYTDGEGNQYFIVRAHTSRQTRIRTLRDLPTRSMAELDELVRLIAQELEG